MFKSSYVIFWIVNTIIVMAFIGLWEYFASSHSLHFILPSPLGIANTLWENAPRFRHHSLATFKEMAGGFIMAFFAAFPLAWMMSSITSFRSLLQPVFVAVQCIPMFALAPLMILWFGWSYMAIIVPTALMIFFPLTIAIYQGLCATPNHFLEFFRMHSATPWQTFCKLQLPWAMPHLFTGFRIAVALAGIGAVAGEWAGAQEGLGLLMLESRRGADTEMMFGALFCLTMLSLAVYSFVVIVERSIGRRYYRMQTLKSILSLILCSLIIGGCQPSTPKVQETTLLLDWLPNPNHIPLYAGIEKGFFAEQGINLKIIKVADPSDTIPFLTSKQVSICLTYMPHTTQALARGADLLPIGVLIAEPLNAIIYRTGEGINSPEDLNGRVCGYCVDGYHTDFLKTMLSYYDIEPSSWRNVSFDLVSTLANKQVDFIYGAYWNVEMENLRAGGIDTAFYPLSAFGVPTYYELIFLALGSSPETQPDFIQAFQQALQNSIDYAKQNPSQAFDMYLKANPDKSLKTRQWEHVAWQKTIPTLANRQYIDPFVWNTFVDWLIDKQLLEGSSHLKMKQ